MKIFQTLTEWQTFRKILSKDQSLGFVPTMGNLHAGHLSLMTASQKENHATAVSIFINPTQFNQPADFTQYPRTLESDLELLEKANVDYCLLPSESEMYSDQYHYRIEENHRSLTLEGKHRPGHFTGVLTIVMKLLNLVKPTTCYFGEKDYQQYQLIRDMVKAFFMDIEIKVCPTIREDSGLAYSSRNHRLSPEQRPLADQFATIFHQSNHCEQIKMALRALGIQVDYIEEVDKRRYAAVLLGNIRLIDNYPVDV